MSTTVDPTTGIVPTRPVPSVPPPVGRHAGSPSVGACHGACSAYSWWSSRRSGPSPCIGWSTSPCLANAQLQLLTPTFVPFGGSFDNFTAVIAGSGFTNALRMSLAVSLVTVVVAPVFAFFAALAISRFCFRGRKTLSSRCWSFRCCPPRDSSSSRTSSWAA